MTKLADIEGAALRLTDKERLHLADKLLGSLPPPPAASEPDEILAEALRRDAELESGQVKPLSEDAFWAGVRRKRELGRGQGMGLAGQLAMVRESFSV